MTYHTTGQVNYHGLEQDIPSYFEPLPEISKSNHFLSVSIPRLDKLTVLTRNTRANDAIVIVPDHAALERLSVAVAVVPPNVSREVPGTLCRIDWDLFSVLVVRVESPLAPEIGDNFVFAIPPSPGNLRSMSIGQAQLAYSQRKVGHRGLGIYPPNGEGVYTLFPAVEMRITPKVKVEFVEPDFAIELIEDRSAPHVVHFRILRNGEVVRKNDLRSLIRFIELDAEL